MSVVTNKSIFRQVKRGPRAQVVKAPIAEIFLHQAWPIPFFFAINFSLFIEG